MHIQVHQWPSSKASGDAMERDSVHSAEGSMTDSGRGPSEEGGDGRPRYIPPPPPPTRGSYWLLQQRSSRKTTGTNRVCSVRFQGLHTTPEELDETIDASVTTGVGSCPVGGRRNDSSPVGSGRCPCGHGENPAGRGGEEEDGPAMANEAEEDCFCTQSLLEQNASADAIVASNSNRLRRNSFCDRANSSQTPVTDEIIFDV